MFKQLSLAAAALAMGGTAVIPATSVAAQGYDGRYDRGYADGRYQDRGYDNRYYNGGGYNGGYNDGRYYDRSYDDYRRYKKCRNQGTAGTIIGAIAGGLLGRSVTSHNGTGTILGAGAGALAGRAIDRADRPAYCR